MNVSPIVESEFARTVMAVPPFTRGMTSGSGRPDSASKR